MFKKMMSIVPVAVLAVAVSTNVQASTITVQEGDTLWDLSRANNTSVENIQMLNQLTTDLIHPGDVLNVASEKQYTVKQGDTLWDIAINHQVTVSQIKEWNQLQSDFIRPGLTLVIFEGAKTSKTAVTKQTLMPAAQESKESTPKAVAPSTGKTEAKQSAPKATAPATSNTEVKESTPEAVVPSTNNTEAKESAPEATTPSTSQSGSQEIAPEAPASSTNDTNSKEITVEATAYTASCEGCSGITATGINLKENPDAKVISVDPEIIPLGSKVYVEGYGEAIAGDTGGAIKGKRIDVFVPSQQDAIDFGVKQLNVKILN